MRRELQRYTLPDFAEIQKKKKRFLYNFTFLTGGTWT